ncbi:P-loop containing nucleoside triphosphate hydrolase protein, partial [Mycena vulgaris]
MPSQPIATETRLNNILKCFTIAVDSLEVLATTFKTPFLEPISSTAKSLLTAVQTVKQNKSDCTQLLEQTYGFLCAIVSLHMKAEAGSDLTPSMMNDLGKFTDTLYKIHTFVEAQQEKSKIRHFFRQGEMSKLFKDCNSGLQEALDQFKLQDINLLTEVVVMQKFAEDRHKEVLELIEAFSDGTASDKGSLTNRVLSSSYNSSTSISMLPSEPKIFHGREAELADILKLFMQETPRIAILGGGGMGKTSLARAVLHHSTITGEYAQHRIFVACDSTLSKDELVILIGAHLGLKPTKNLAKAILHHFATNPACLLILDNLETLWEPTEIRRDIEEFLSLLTEIKHLALIITMRGTERPASVQWTRPFLLALKPLTPAAARRTFIDIADDGHDSDDMDKVLLLTDNMPLAIDLMAHLVESEGCSNVLARWEEEKTSVISDGYDRRSNLDLSISMSLSSPRITSVHQCQDLLSLLSMLPDGLSDIELVQSKLPIKDTLSCKAALLSTSLAYSDDQRRFKVLVPIREYMARSYPPMDSLVQFLLKYFHQLLEFRYKYYGTISASEMTLQITSNFSNIQGLILNRLQHQSPVAVDTLYCILYLNAFSRLAGRGLTPLMDQIGHTQSLPSELEVYMITEIFSSWIIYPIANPEELVDKVMKQLPHFDDSDIKYSTTLWDTIIKA